MSYHHGETDTAEAHYREHVRGRLIRKHQGLSLTACLGVVLALALVMLAWEIPTDNDEFYGIVGTQQTYGIH